MGFSEARCGERICWLTSPHCDILGVELHSDVIVGFKQKSYGQVCILERSL